MDNSDGRSAVILLSTYRGTRHLPALMQSLIDQDWDRCRICIRDDGSGDDTPDLLSQYRNRHGVDVSNGINLGSKNSFMELLKTAPPADAYLFADQDDLWYRDKVRRAMTALAGRPPDRPTLYCSALDLVSENMAPLGRSPRWPRQPAFENALVENIATGCTIALNPGAARLISNTPMPDAALMHDWWCYLVVSAFGDVIYDPRPSLAYRIHAHNQVGLPTSNVGWLLAKARRQLKQNSLALLVKQALAFAEIFGSSLTPNQSQAISEFAATRTMMGRLSFIRNAPVHRQFTSDQLAFLLLVLFGGLRS